MTALRIRTSFMGELIIDLSYWTVNNASKQYEFFYVFLYRIMLGTWVCIEIGFYQPL